MIDKAVDDVGAAGFVVLIVMVRGDLMSDAVALVDVALAVVCGVCADSSTGCAREEKEDEAELEDCATRSKFRSRHVNFKITPSKLVQKTWPHCHT